MRYIFTAVFLFIISTALIAQQATAISFQHADKTIYGTFTTPSGSGKFPTIIINPGTGANDRDGTIQMIGGNVACLYPQLLNTTLKPYKELGDALVEAGYAVLRYDKIEYTYPTNLGNITFHKLWLPVESAIDYIKTRDDVDTTNIVLIGHSEGSSLIPHIAKNRNDIKALVSLAGPRTPLDSLLGYQLVHIAQTCGGNVAQTQTQVNQILQYFELIRSNNWNATTPPLFGAPASAWYDYISAVDSVAINYNISNLPTLFIGLEEDMNVPPQELERFQNEVTITNDFWSIPDLIHYMTPNNDPHVSVALTDTIVYWLNQNIITGLKEAEIDENQMLVFPNPFTHEVSLSIDYSLKNGNVFLFDITGRVIFSKHEKNIASGTVLKYDLGHLPKGVYFMELNSENGRQVQKVVKQ